MTLLYQIRKENLRSLKIIIAATVIASNPLAFTENELSMVLNFPDYSALLLRAQDTIL